MAFTSTPLMTLVADNLVRLSSADVENLFGLAEGDSGTIGLTGKTVPSEVTLMPAFQPTPYVVDNGASTDDIFTIGLSDSIQVYITKTGFDSTHEVPIRVEKAGNDPTNFEITLTNDVATEGQGCDFEVYIRFH